MKKLREINHIFYMTILYLTTSISITLYRKEIPKVFTVDELLKYRYLILITLILTTFYFLSNYHKNTKEILKKISLLALYSIILLIGINFPNLGIESINYGLIIYLGIVYIFIYANSNSEKQSKINEEKEAFLYPSRERMSEVFNKALENYNLIALDGVWRSGKTTFMDILMKRNNEKYHYIPVNIMLFENRNLLKREFLNQLKEVFKDEGILKGTLIDFEYYLGEVSNNWMNILNKMIFSKSESFKESNDKLKNEIYSLEKGIVVGIDNLERIYGESEHEWKEILGFIHELQEIGIKIVVMADFDKVLGAKEGEIFNYDYYDKFYEVKIKLNEVTANEVIDEISIGSEGVKKTWLKEQLDRLKNRMEGYCLSDSYGEFEKKQSSLEQKYKYIDSASKSDSNIPRIKVEIKELEEYMEREVTVVDKNLELLSRFNEGIKNPRKVKKIINDTALKKKNVTNIFNFVSDEGYDEVLLKSVIFQLFYFDFIDEYKEMGLYSFTEKDKVFKYFFKDIGEAHRAINRILFYNFEDDKIKGRIEHLEDTDEVNLEKVLKELEVYDERLDPDTDRSYTKKVYKIIEENLVKLEKAKKIEVNRIIRENEEFICRMNYLCYPKELGIYGKISYKFDEKNILKACDEIIIHLHKKIYYEGFPSDLGEINVLSPKGFKSLLSAYSGVSKGERSEYKELNYEESKKSFTLADIEFMKKKVKEVEKGVVFNLIKVEELICCGFDSLLKVLENELNKKKQDSKNLIEQLDKNKWNSLSKEKKYKKLQKYSPGQLRYYESTFLIALIKFLRGVSEIETDKKVLLEIDKALDIAERWSDVKLIKEKSIKIKGMDVEEKEIEIEKLMEWINKIPQKSRREIFGGGWEEYIEGLREIGIEWNPEKLVVEAKNKKSVVEDSK